MMGREQQLRQQLAQEAARLLAEQGLHDFAWARRKAAERLGCRDRRLLPDHREIEQALREYQQLFHRERQSSGLERLRRTALQAMTALQAFQPRLAGPVLSGTAEQHSAVELHLFAGAPEEVAMALMDLHIPWEAGERRLSYGGGRHETHPMFHFRAGGVVVELICFPPEGLRQAPLSRIDGQPERRADAAEVGRLLD
jgi:hypothetical protein